MDPVTAAGPFARVAVGHSGGAEVLVVGLLDPKTSSSWRDAPIDIDRPAATLAAFFEPLGGHGHEDAAPLSQLAAHLVHDALSRGDLRTEGLGASLVAALSLANEAILRESRQPRYTGCASLAMVAVFDRASLIVAQVGSGAAILLRDGAWCLLSREQTLRRALRDGGSGRWERYPRNVGLSFLGKEARLTPVVSSVAPRRGDRLLLCTERLMHRLGMPAVLSTLLEGARKSKVFRGCQAFVARLAS